MSANHHFRSFEGCEAAARSGRSANDPFADIRVFAIQGYACRLAADPSKNTRASP